jgi:hypothetical protein
VQILLHFLVRDLVFRQLAVAEAQQLGAVGDAERRRRIRLKERFRIAGEEIRQRPDIGVMHLGDGCFAGIYHRAALDACAGRTGDLQRRMTIRDAVRRLIGAALNPQHRTDQNLAAVVAEIGHIHGVALAHRAGDLADDDKIPGALLSELVLDSHHKFLRLALKHRIQKSHISCPLCIPPPCGSAVALRSLYPACFCFQCTLIRWKRGRSCGKNLPDALFR